MAIVPLLIRDYNNNNYRNNNLIMMSALCNMVSNIEISYKIIKGGMSNRASFTLEEVKGLSLENVAAYLKNKSSLESRQKDIYNTRQLIISLKNHTLDNLRMEFKANNDMVNLQKFLWLMRQCIQFSEKTKYEAYYQIVRLFQQIDVDGSELIDWAELLEYISCSGWTDQKVSQGEDQLEANNNVRDRIYVYSHKQLLKFRKNPIRKIIQIEKLNLLCLLEKKTNDIQFITIDGAPNQFNLTAIQNRKVSSLDYNEKERLFGILFLDKEIVFIEEGQIQKKYNSIVAEGNETEIRSLPLHELWVLIGLDYSLHIFSSPKSHKRFRTRFRPHHQPLTGITEISNPIALVTSSLDGKLKIWSLSYKQLLIELNPSKEQQITKSKGVRGVTAHNNNNGFLSYLATWTFSPEISIWSPSTSLAKPYVGMLKGQSAIVQECSFCPHQPYLVSIDIKKAIRVWQIESMSCIQSWTLQDEGCNLYHLPCSPYLTIYNKLLSFQKIKTATKALDMLENTKQQISEPKIMGIDFCSYYDYLLILTNEDLRVVDINTCALVQTIRPMNSAEQFITMTKKINRRVFVASNLGYIYFYKIDSGVQLRKFQALPKNPAEKSKVPRDAISDIKFMYYHQKTSILMVGIETPEESFIYTYDELLSEQSVEIKEVCFNQTNMQHFAFSVELEIFCIGSQKGLITVWDYEKFTILNKIQLNKEIKKIEFEEEHGVLIVLTGNQLLLYTMEENCLIKNKISLKSLIKPSFNDSRLIQNQLMSFSFLKASQVSIEKIQDSKKALRRLAGLEFNNSQFKRFQQQCSVVKDRMFFCISDSEDILFYDLSSIFEVISYVEPKIVKSNQHLLKEKKQVNIKAASFHYDSQESCLEVYHFAQCKLKTDSPIFVSRLRDCDIFAVYSDSLLHFHKPTSQISAKWIIAYPKYLLWKLTHPVFEKVIKRIQKMVKALQRIEQVPDLEKFKVYFLINRYFNRQSFQNLLLFTKKKQKKIRFTAAQAKSPFSMPISESNGDGQYQSPSKNINQIDNQYQDRLKNNFFQGEFDKRDRRQQVVRNKKNNNVQKKVSAIENKVNRISSMSAGKIRKPIQMTNGFKDRETKMKASKSLYRIKATMISAVANYNEGRKNYEALLRKVTKIRILNNSVANKKKTLHI